MDSPNSHFKKLMKSFKTAMLTTRNSEGILHSRPMMVASASTDGVLWFCTSLDSRAVDEIKTDSHVNVSMQGRTRYVSLAGDATVSQDRAKIEQMWQEPWRVWFPDGPQDPHLCLLKIDAHEAEYWDNGGVQRIKFLAEAARAYVTGSTPDFDPEQHESVSLQ